MVLKLKSLLGVASIAILQGCSLFGSHAVEEASFSVVEEQGPFQVRRYTEMVVVETSSEEKDFKAASRVTFNRLFDYISGANSTATETSMTAPVLAAQEVQPGRKIAMTSPVLAKPAHSGKEGWVLSFVLPPGMQRENAPLPTDPNVKLKEVPAKWVVAKRYSGFWDEERFIKESEILSEWLVKKGYRRAGPPVYAGYDPPWTLPWYRRNEVLIEVKPDA